MHMLRTNFYVPSYSNDCPQRPGIDLKKGSYLDQILPQHESLYPIGLKSARIEILHSGNFFTKWIKFECNYCKAVFALCSGTHCGGFQFLLILDLWGISFQAVVVFDLGKDLLFKSF